MKIVNKIAAAISMAMAVGGLATTAQAQSDTEFRGKYFFQSFLGAELTDSGVADGVLLDADLIRGNNADEAVIALSTNPINTNPFQFFNANTTERSLVVFFNNGQPLQNVRGLHDPVVLNFGVSVQYYLLSEDDLAAAGRSIDEVVDVVAVDAIDHALNWSDFGFTEVDLPAPDPAPTEDDIILGTDGNDRLRGTDGVDVFISQGGARDRMAGGAGGDFFVVGADVDDGVSNRDIILDFEPGRDVLVIDHGARTFSARARNGNFVLQFQGSDRDRVIFRNTTVTSTGQYETIRLNDAFSIADIQPEPPASEPEPIPEPIVAGNGLISVLGTSGNDRLLGTDDADAIDGLAGADGIFGEGGADYFLFGSTANNGVTERDTIADFNIDEDTIVFEQGVDIVAVDERNTGIAITLSGDGDVVFVQGLHISRSGFGAIPILYEDGAFLE